LFPKLLGIFTGRNFQHGHVFVGQHDIAGMQGGIDVARRRLADQCVDHVAPVPARHAIDIDLYGTNQGGTDANIGDDALVSVGPGKAVRLLNPRPDGDSLVFAVDPRFVRDIMRSVKSERVMAELWN